MQSDVARSLTEAGILPRYHKQSLTDYGPLGAGYADWVKTAGPELGKQGGLVVLHGSGQSEHVLMLARAFHMNGVGVRVKTLTQIAAILKHGGDRREEMDEAPALFISPAQAGRRACPLDGYQCDVVDKYIRDRIGHRRTVVMYWATDSSLDATDPLHQWWDEDFIQWAQASGTILYKADVARRGIGK